MRATTTIGSMALVVLGFAICQATGQSTKPAAGWSPDATAAKKLGAAVEVEQYSLRIPEGYDLQETPGTPAGINIKGWAGPARDDGTKASLQLNLIVFPPAEREKFKDLSLEEIAEKLANAVKRRRTNWKQGKPEKGKINGINFVRMSWEGTDPTKKLEMRGFLYVARDGETIIQLSSQDPTSSAKQTLPIAEASVLSFQKKK